MSSSLVQVFIRIREFIPVEDPGTAVPCLRIDDEGTTTTIVSSLEDQSPNRGAGYSFHFSQCFWSLQSHPTSGVPYSDQSVVYKAVGLPLVDAALSGFNVCVLAYGQTGSGKTFTMLGDLASCSQRAALLTEASGLVPRFLHDVAARVTQSIAVAADHVEAPTLEMSCFELYNETVIDLLTYPPRAMPRNCIRSHPIHGPCVPGLSRADVASLDDCIVPLRNAFRHRKTSANAKNEQSSRSHMVLQLYYNSTRADAQQQEGSTAPSGTSCHSHSTMNLVDLAGSERASDISAHCTMMRETQAINLSLHTLKRVIDALTDDHQTGQGQKPPYRDSSLTWLLSTSLGGNSRTSIIATVSPHVSNVDESRRTLEYAAKARSIRNPAKSNQVDTAALIAQYKAELDAMKVLLADKDRQLMDARATPKTSEQRLPHDDVDAVDDEVVQDTCRVLEHTIAMLEDEHLQATRTLRASMLLKPTCEEAPAPKPAPAVNTHVDGLQQQWREAMRNAAGPFGVMNVHYQLVRVKTLPFHRRPIEVDRLSAEDEDEVTDLANNNNSGHFRSASLSAHVTHGDDTVAAVCSLLRRNPTGFSVLSTSKGEVLIVTSTSTTYSPTFDDVSLVLRVLSRLDVKPLVLWSQIGLSRLRDQSTAVQMRVLKECPEARTLIRGLIMYHAPPYMRDVVDLAKQIFSDALSGVPLWYASTPQRMARHIPLEELPHSCGGSVHLDAMATALSLVAALTSPSPTFATVSDVRCCHISSPCVLHAATSATPPPDPCSRVSDVDIADMGELHESLQRSGDVARGSARITSAVASSTAEARGDSSAIG
eukprot:PhM_4_TR5043/c0_g1_i3/m.76627/K17915/KIF14; kinesin family member 14